jgi:hypothetical protein
MLRTGKEHLESLRDGRVVYIGSEKVDDVTRHPAFRNAAATVAAIYDMKADPANRDTLTYEEDGGATPSIFCVRARAMICNAAWWGTGKSPMPPSACSAARPTTSPRSSPVWL